MVGQISVGVDTGWDRGKFLRTSPRSSEGSPLMTSGSWRHPAPGCQRGLPSPLANWLPTPDEPFQMHSHDDQREALQVAAGQRRTSGWSGRSAHWSALPSARTSPPKGGTKNVRFLPVAIYSKEPNQIAEVSGPALHWSIHCDILILPLYTITIL